MLLLPTHSYAETAIPADLFSEIRSAAQLSQGDIVYVYFWASWCQPCRKSFPGMNAMHKKYQANGFKVLAINVDKERALAAEFLQKVPAAFPIFYDPDGRLAEAFQLKGMPSSFMIDDQGHVRVAHIGFFADRTPVYEKNPSIAHTIILRTR